MNEGYKICKEWVVKMDFELSAIGAADLFGTLEGEIALE